MILAFDAVRAIAHERGDAIVVSTQTPANYWEVVSDKPDLDLAVFGAMGKASSVALGLALARADEKVVVLDSDGALLMNLGSLVTIAGQEPGNLVHFVFEDGVYLATGGQPVPGAGKVNLAGMARDAGYRQSYEFDDLEDFASELPDIMEKPGPVFVSLKIRHADDVPEFHASDTGAGMRRLAATLREG